MTLSKSASLPTQYSLDYIKFDGSAKKGEQESPAKLEFSELSKGTYVIVGTPAAFSPPCSEQHLPGYVTGLRDFSSKGAKIIVLSKDNLFANYAWAQKFGVSDKQDQIIFASDTNLKFSKGVGLSTTEFDPLGEVAARYAIIVKDGVVSYVAKEKAITEVTVSSAEKVLNEL